MHFFENFYLITGKNSKEKTTKLNNKLHPSVMTASMRRGMLCISCWHSWGVTSFQQVLMASFSCSQVFGWCLCNFFFTIPHKFSMGFKWGELAGQSNTCTWQFSHHACVDFAECGGARSCWKMNSLSPKSWSAAGTMKYSLVNWISW